GAGAGRPGGDPLAAPGPRPRGAGGRPAAPAAPPRADRRSGVHRPEGPRPGGAGVLRRHWLSAVLLLAAIGIWQAVASLPGVDDLTLASPIETARALGNDS